MTAIQLAEFLHLEKSSVSRMVRKLIEAGELKETTDPIDARSKQLALTTKGRRTLAALHDFGRRQVLRRAQPSERIRTADGVRRSGAVCPRVESRRRIAETR